MARLWPVAAVALAAGLLACDRGSNAPVIKPLDQPLAASEPFRFSQGQEDDTRRSVSGIACHKAGKGLCLLAFDEGAEARLATLAPHAFTPQPEKLALVDGGELDAEGAAVGDDFFYVTGSHAVKRKSCDVNEASRTVVRFRAAPATGRPALDPQTGGLVDRKAVDTLWTALGTNPEIAPFMAKCLGSKPIKHSDKTGELGLNIEGLAYADHRLFFGLRGPTGKNRAKIVSVDADALFDGPAESLKLDVASPEVGWGRGIRDMTAVEGGLLLLVGPDDDHKKSPPGWGFVFWDGKTARPLADLNLKSVKRNKVAGCKDKAPRPEAVAVADVDEKRYRVVVLSDGLCDGGPMWFDVPRPKAKG